MGEDKVIWFQCHKTKGKPKKLSNESIKHLSISEIFIYDFLTPIDEDAQE